MRAMVWRQPGPIESVPLQEREAPIPALGRGEVLIRVEACAVCRTSGATDEPDRN
jgi:propanol-preferring alcohol dehydrogenase